MIFKSKNGISLYHFLCKLLLKYFNIWNILSLNFTLDFKSRFIINKLMNTHKPPNLPYFIPHASLLTEYFCLFKNNFKEFPGCLVVRIPSFHYRGLGSILGRETEIPQGVQCSQKKKIIMIQWFKKLTILSYKYV